MTRAGEGATASDAPVAGSWMFLYEDLLGGIIHAINNALTVIDVSLELASATDATREIASLRAEMRRLEGLVALITTLSGRSAGEEGLELRTVMDVAFSIHAFNTATRMVAHTLRIVGDVPPVRAPRSTLMRLMLLIIDDAKRACMTAGRTVEIEINGDTERVRISAPSRPVRHGDALQLAAACGGTLRVADGIQVLELPSLQRLRRTSATTTPVDAITPKRAAES